MILFCPDNGQHTSTDVDYQCRQLLKPSVPTPTIERSVRTQNTRSSITNSSTAWQHPLLAVAMTGIYSQTQILPNKPSTQPTPGSFLLLSKGRKKKCELVLEIDPLQRQSAIETVAQVPLTNYRGLIRWTNFLCESRGSQPG